MRAWSVTAFGTPPHLVALQEPVPGPGDALVRVSAVGLNFADLLMLEGRYQTRPALPYTPGMEFSGVVESLGPGTAGPLPGTRVLGVCGSGALADRICISANRLSALPPQMPFAEAAGFSITYGTAHLALTHRARLQPGEALLVTGAAGGAGLTAVEIGKLLGARVIATARGPERCAAAGRAGADLTIDSDSPGLKEALRAAGGVDVVYDTVGGPAFDEALRATRPDGRLLTIGFASGAVPQIAANLLLVKNLTVIGFWYGGYEIHAPHLVAGSMDTLLGWYATGRLKPQVSNILPFAAFPDGLALLRNRTATGKVVISLDQATPTRSA